jgi:ribonuclease P protein component
VQESDLSVLPVTQRLRGPQQFTEVVRRGTRIRRSPVLIHHLATLADAAVTDDGRLGFIVNKAVGNSVVRHRTVRRLRAQMRERLALLPAGSGTVIRALPESASADSAVIGAALDSALQALARAGKPRSSTSATVRTSTLSLSERS